MSTAPLKSAKTAKPTQANPLLPLALEITIRRATSIALLDISLLDRFLAVIWGKTYSRIQPARNVCLESIDAEPETYTVTLQT
eukprot:5615525-Amphidinium_carterae.1